MIRKNNIYMYRGRLVRVVLGDENIVNLQAITVGVAEAKDADGKDIFVPTVAFSTGRYNRVNVKDLRQASKDKIQLWVQWLRNVRRRTREEHMRRLGTHRTHASAYRHDIVDPASYKDA